MKRQLFTASGLFLLVLGGTAQAQNTNNNSTGSNSAATQPAPTATATTNANAPSPPANPAPVPSNPVTAALAPTAPVTPPAAPAVPAPATATVPATTTVAPAATAPAAQANATSDANAKAAQDAATADDANQAKSAKKKGARGAQSNVSSISLAPSAPQVSTLPGSVMPGFEQAASISPGDWKFDVHGLFVLPLAIGINKRDNPGADQKKMTLHSPPVTPEDREGFNWTGVTPQPWVQMNFSYGNRDVTANVILSARTVTNANSYFNPPDYQGVTDAFLTYRPPLARPINLTIDVGAFTNRYGHMGEYDSGRYGQSIIARLSGVGTNVRASIPAGDVQWLFETGVMGQIGKAPLGVEPSGWNNFADANVGSTYAVHGHVGARFAKNAELVGHAIYAFEQDDRSNPTDQPDGSLTVLGVDGHVSAGYLGHFYLGLAHTNATNARGISPVVRILESPGGPGLNRTYFCGPTNVNCPGNGTLTTLGAQYDLSLGNLLSHPIAHNADSPDVVLAFFGIYTKVGSDQVGYNDVKKLKYGAEATYSIASWFAASGRYDRVLANTDDAHQTYAVISPRLIFHSDWNSQDQVVLQYSHYMVGSGVPVITGYPPAPNLYTVPDADVVSLTAAIWW